MKNHQIVVLVKECLKGDKDSYSLIIRHSQQKALESVLSSLPVKYRTALMLKYHHDLSYKEISEIMEIPFNTVGSLILRGKKELREALK